MTEWKEVKFGEVTTNFDSMRKPVKGSNRAAGIYPYYGASGIVDYVDNYIFDGEYLLVAEDGENLKTRKTPIAFMASGKFWVNNHAHIVQGNDKAITRYLAYSLSKEDISGYITGSTIPKLSQRSLNEITFLLPPLETQKSIVGVLSSLDNKIELNRQMNTTLEATARALFKSWFVDFDPVRAKMGGRAPDGLSADIAALFPDALVDSSLGEIPKGWEIDKFSRIANQTKTTVNPSLFPEEEFLHFSLPAYDTYQQPVLQFGTEIKSNKTPVSSQHVLLSKLNPETPRVWFVPNLLGTVS
jgi:type I restriction enzyme S subunit